MPKGHKAIDWTPANDAKLLLTILSVENIHPNYAAVAAAFGSGLDAQAIKNRLNRLRKIAADQGLMAQKTDLNASSAPSSSTDRKGTKDKNSGTLAAPANSLDANTHPPTPRHIQQQKVLTGRITKPVLKTPTGKPFIPSKNALKDASNDREDEDEHEDEDEGVKVEEWDE